MFVGGWTVSSWGIDCRGLDCDYTRGWGAESRDWGGRKVTWRAAWQGEIGRRDRKVSE